MRPRASWAVAPVRPLRRRAARDGDAADNARRGPRPPSEAEIVLGRSPRNPCNHSSPWPTARRISPTKKGDARTATPIAMPQTGDRLHHLALRDREPPRGGPPTDGRRTCRTSGPSRGELRAAGPSAGGSTRRSWLFPPRRWPGGMPGPALARRKRFRVPPGFACRDVSFRSKTRAKPEPLSRYSHKPVTMKAEGAEPLHVLSAHRPSDALEE